MKILTINASNNINKYCKPKLNKSINSNQEQTEISFGAKGKKYSPWVFVLAGIIAILPLPIALSRSKKYREANQ